MCLEIIDFIYTYKKWFSIKYATMVDIPNDLTKPNHIYLISMFKKDLALNNLRLLIYQLNQIIYI